MPIVINEIEITVEVSNPQASTGGTSSSGVDNQRIVQECVDKVLEIIHLKLER